MSRIARSFCRYTLNFSRNFQTLFKVVAWSCASSHCVEFQVLLGHRHTCFGVVFVCLIVEGLVGGVSGFFIMALICISLITNVAGYLFFFFFLWISYFFFMFCICVSFHVFVCQDILPLVAFLFKWFTQWGWGSGACFVGFECWHLFMWIHIHLQWYAFSLSVWFIFSFFW